MDPHVPTEKERERERVRSCLFFVGISAVAIKKEEKRKYGWRTK